MSSFWQENITVGSLSFPRIMAAPLDGITDSPMRVLLRAYSPTELLFGEMRHVALVTNEKSGICLKYDPIEHPISFQFSANNTQFIASACEKVIAAGFDMINLNIGCPARNVVSSGSGSALMADEDRLKILLREFIRAINGRVPFTVKIRAGFKKKNAVEIARLCEGEGAQMLVIHPRTQPEGFTGIPDTNLVAQVKAAINIPVIYSGNINSFARAEKVRVQANIDGVMIGRALWGCPWKMKEITEASLGRTFTTTTADNIRLALAHLDLNMQYYGPRGFQSFKKQLPVYIKSMDGAAALRSRLLTLQSYEELVGELNNLMLSCQVPVSSSLIAAPSL